MSTPSYKRFPPSLKLLLSGFLVFWLITAAFPFLWTLWGSFKVEGDFFSKADWTDALTGQMTQVETGGTVTGDGYQGAWVQEQFWKAAWNSTIVCFFVVTISLSFSTLAGYALSRSPYNYAFWLLIAALIFRAMPQITLVSGYLLPFYRARSGTIATSTPSSRCRGFGVGIFRTMSQQSRSEHG